MWEPFQERARKMVVLAQEEAERTGGRQITTEHLILGLLAEGSSPAAALLVERGIALERARDALTPAEPADAARGEGDFTFGSDGKRAIETAFEVARESGHNFVGTEHFLDAILRLNHSPGYAMLERLLGERWRMDELATAVKREVGSQGPIVHIQSASPGIGPEHAAARPITDAEARLFSACLECTSRTAAGDRELFERAKQLYTAAVDAIRKTRER